MKFLAVVVCLVLAVAWAFQVRSASDRVAREQISGQLVRAEFKGQPNLTEAEVWHLRSAMAPLYDRSLLSLHAAYLIAGNVILAGAAIWIWMMCTQKGKRDLPDTVHPADGTDQSPGDTRLERSIRVWLIFGVAGFLLLVFVLMKLGKPD